MSKYSAKAKKTLLNHDRSWDRQDWDTSVLYSEPLVGLRMVPPATRPLPGDVLLGYAVIPPKKFKQGFSTRGWLATGVVGVIFWPIAWLPATFKWSYETVQMPVYGPHDGADFAAPTAGDTTIPDPVKPGNL